jgi:hypothetical protein
VAFGVAGEVELPSALGRGETAFAGSGVPLAGRGLGRGELVGVGVGVAGGVAVGVATGEGLGDGVARIAGATVIAIGRPPSAAPAQSCRWWAWFGQVEIPA